MRGLGSARRRLRPSRRAAARAWGAFVDWFNQLELSENAILLGFAVAIGAATALGVVGFYRLIDLSYEVFFRWPGERISVAAYRPLLTGAGLFAAWWIMRRIGRGHDGLNVPDVQLAVAHRGGDVPTRPAVARTAASAVTIGAGGSAGAEGPVAVLGAAMGSLLGRSFRFHPVRVKVLVAAGGAAGISAAFNAPLAGAFFALEEMLGTFAAGAFPPVVVASVVAAVVSRSVFGDHPAFPVPEEYGYTLAREVAVFYPILGVIAALVGVAFVRGYFSTETLFTKLRIPRWLVPWIGGAAVGVLVVISGERLIGEGHLGFDVSLFGRLPWYGLAALAFGKILATSITLGSGGSGGVFTPALFVGAVTGGAFGSALAQLFPGLGLSPEAYALVGMGALVAAATHAPITGILLVFEMTNDYGIVLPLMLATVIAYVVAHRIERDSLYSGWLRRRGERIEYGADRDVLAGVRVEEVYDRNPQVIGEGAPVTELLAHLGDASRSEFPVVDDDLRLRGVITVAELGRVARDHQDISPVLVAADLVVPTETITPDATLLDAIRKLGVRGAASVAVVDPGTGRLLGMLGRAEVLARYEREVARVEAGRV